MNAWLLSILCLAPLASQDPGQTIPAAPILPAASDSATPQEGEDQAFASLVKEYQEAMQAWYQAIEQLSEAEQAAGKWPESPEPAYRKRFQALAEKGGGQAELWCLEHQTREYPVRPDSPTVEEWRKRAAALVERYPDAAWADGIPPVLSEGVDRGCTRQQVDALLVRLGKTSTREAVRRAALLARVDLWGEGYGAFSTGSDRQEAARRAQGIALCREFLKKWPDATEAAHARGQLFQLQRVQPGLEAPEIVGKDVDGKELRLSALRGKVVLIEFWGFW